jgi:xanthine dehydrogenase molybdopterin-binding subunit B
MSWSASGKIVQVVTASFGTQTNFTTTTMTDTGLTASITPTSASNTILVFANLSGLKVANAANSINFQLLRGASVIAGGGQYNVFWQTGTASAPSEIQVPTKLITFLDSPATTSSTTYKVQCAARTASTTVTLNVNDGGSVAAVSTLILMEVTP